MRKMTTSFFIISLLAMSGCIPATPEAIAEGFEEYATYIKDHRANLCYMRYYDRIVTEVPCTPEVERLLLNPHAPANMR